MLVKIEGYWKVGQRGIRDELLLASCYTQLYNWGLPRCYSGLGHGIAFFVSFEAPLPCCWLRSPRTIAVSMRFGSLPTFPGAVYTPMVFWQLWVCGRGNPHRPPNFYKPFTTSPNRCSSYTLRTVFNFYICKLYHICIPSLYHATLRSLLAVEWTLKEEEMKTKKAERKTREERKELGGDFWGCLSRFYPPLPLQR